MRAIAIAKPGGPDVLTLTERPLPWPDERQLLIKVAAAGINRPDILQRKGLYAPPPGASDLPGLEIAGEVVAMGSEARRWRVGDKVCALTTGGGYAEFCCVEEAHALPLPVGFSMTQAAALPEAFFTVWHNLVERGKLKSGETLLIHGGSSGIGTTAITLGKAFGAQVIVTAGSPGKCAACLALGADAAFDRNGDWAASVMDMTAGRGVDVILDIAGGRTVEKNYQAAAFEGRIVQIAFIQGAAAALDLAILMTKRLIHTGSTLRPQSIAAKARIARALEEQVWPLLNTGACHPVIYATYPLDEAAKAHQMMESGVHFGKIILDVALQ